MIVQIKNNFPLIFNDFNDGSSNILPSSVILKMFYPLYDDFQRFFWNFKQFPQHFKSFYDILGDGYAG